MLRRVLTLVFLVAVCLNSAESASAAEIDSGMTYCFCPEDFSSETSLAGICLTDLPQGGSLTLGSRILQPGDILTADQVAMMTFSSVPRESDGEVQVGYLPIYDTHVAEASVMTISLRGREDKAPVAEDMALETYKNLPNTGKLKVSDPEREPITYTVIRQPRRGTVTVAEDGTFTYTPKKNKVGVDSFTYTAADPAGKVSREATVTITILKPADAAQYQDTQGHDCRFAAEWMKNTGIFVGETLAGDPCFSPEKAVTRGEFLTMLVKALDIPAEEELQLTGYTDDVPQWLKPYLMAAMRSGLTAGLPNQETFGADIPITGGEAAVMLRNALDIRVDAVVEEESAIPTWAQSAVLAMKTGGISLDAQAQLTRADTAQILYQTVRLASEPTRDWNVTE